MRKSLNNVFAVITSIFLFITSIIPSAISYASDNINDFTIEYTYEDDTVTAVLSLGGIIDTKCFDVLFKYNKQKYELTELSSFDSNVMVNSIPKKGEVIASFSSITSPTKDLNVFTITLTSFEKADISDFECNISDVYDSALEPISYSLKTLWNGNETEENDLPMQTTTESNPAPTTVTSTGENVVVTTATVYPLSSENIFCYSYGYDELSGLVELVLGVKGNVNFMGVEGILEIEADGLSVPVLEESDSGMYPVYNADKKSIQFSFTSSDGKDITEGFQLFKYTFEVVDEDYNIDVIGKISEVFDENMNSVPYSIISSNGNDIPPSTTLSTQITISKSSSSTVTTAVTTESVSVSNIFYYRYDINKETGLVELIFGIKGDVEFMGVEGKLELDFEGLSAPVIEDCDAGMYPIYKDETKTIQFSFASSNGNNITSDLQLFKYNFEVIDENYSLSVKHNISEVFDSNMKNVPYTVVNESELTLPISTTTMSTMTTTTEPTTTTTSTTTTTTEPTTTTTSTTTEPINIITLGDVNADGSVDATDASLVLSEYANLSTGDSGTFSDIQKSAGDVNFDGMTDATDASEILSFYAYLSTGGTETDMSKWRFLLSEN